MIKMYSVIFQVLAMALPVFALGETITLKSGQKIEGSILERSEQAVTINWHGVVVPYKSGEIESIGEGPVRQPEPQEAAVEELLQPRVQFVPPVGWDTQEKEQGFMYSSPDGQALIGILIDKKETPQAAFEIAISKIRYETKAFSDKRIQLSGVPCYVFSFYDKAPNGMTVQTTAYHCLKAGRVYIVSYTAPVESFNAHVSEFEDSLQTFQIIDK